MKTKRFIVLDGWRGVCALLVAIHNLGQTRWVPQFDFVVHSSLFVDFFFVLSGFVITHAYRDKLENFTECGAFLLRRVGRLWPLHVATMAAFIGMSVGMSALKVVSDLFFHRVLELDSAPLSARMVVANLLLVQTLDSQSRLTLNSPSWSISTELWTYFLFSAICLYCGIRKISSTIVFGGIVLASVSVLLVFSPNFLATSTDYAFFRCFYGFFAGHLAYELWRAGPFPMRHEGIVEPVIIALIVLFVQVTGNTVLSMLAPPIFAVAVLVFAQQKGWVSKLLMTTPFVHLGTWSYSIYMGHWLVRKLLVRVEEILQQLMGHQPLASDASVDNIWILSMVLLGYLVVVVILAAVMYRWIEQPGRRLFNRMASALLIHKSESIARFS